jgi:transcriptional regulator GlxA family with amidase domain
VQALAILETCESPGLTVPAQVSIIGVKDLVGVAGMPRRGLYMASLEHVGRSRVRSRFRIGRARKLQVKADHKMEALAKLCGCQSVTGFWVSFKRTTGLS